MLGPQDRVLVVDKCIVTGKTEGEAFFSTWVDGWKSGWISSWIDGWMGGWVDG